MRPRVALAVRSALSALFARWCFERIDVTALAEVGPPPVIARDTAGFDIAIAAEVDALTPGNPEWLVMSEPERRWRVLLVTIVIIGGALAFTAYGLRGQVDPGYPSKLYVTTSGSDLTGDGSQGNPWATPQHAVDEIVSQGLNMGMSRDLVISVGPGIYWDTNIVITDAANPPTGRTITMTATAGPRSVRLIGGHALDTAACTVHSGDIYKCPVDAEFWTLFENGVRAQTARTPNIVVDASYPVAVEPVLEANGANTYTALTYQMGDIDPTGWELADIRVMATPGPGWRWFSDLTSVTAVDTGTRTFTYPRETKYENSGTHYVIWNVLELLDQEGEWYLDRTDAHGAPGGGGHYLYYWPRDLPITSQEIIYPTTEDTVSMLGTDEDHPVRGWVLDGLGVEVSDFVSVYRYAAWGTGTPGQFDPDICDGHTLTACPWAFEAAEPTAQHGLIHLRHVDSGVALTRMHAKNSGLACLYAQLHIQNIVVRDSWFEHCGFDALQFEGGYNEEGDINRDNIISNVKVNNPGEMLQHGAGLRLANSGHNVIQHMNISQGPRNAIYITDFGAADLNNGYAFGNQIGMTAISGMGQDTGDMGAIGVFALGSTATTPAPKPTNYFDQITIDATAAHPDMLNDAPNCVFFDNQSSWQVISNVRCTNTQGAERRLNASDNHTETNCSWNGGFNAALMSAAIGLSPGFPY